MSRARIFVLGLAAVLLLLVGGVWLLPGLLDWNRYRDSIATLASARLGRTVRIGGAVTLHLLPQPILTAQDVAVDVDEDGDGGGDGLGLKARALRLRIGLAALLAGTVDARELTLQGADLRLPWPPTPGLLASRPPSWISGLRAAVEDGRLQVGALVLDHVEGTLATDPDTGTLSAAGVGQAGERRWQFTARLTRPDREGSAGLDVSLDGQGKLQDTGGTFSGQLGVDGALSGRVAARGPDLSILMPAPAVPWRGDGRLSAAGGLAVADELALELGGVPARGAVALRIAPQARLDLALATGRLDLDAWVPALLARPTALQAGLPTGIDVSAEAATWASGTLRRVRAALDLAGDGVVVRELSAALPGETQMELAGRVAGKVAEKTPEKGAKPEPVRPEFTGTVRLQAPDLRTTLRWLQGLVPAPALELPDTVLRQASLSARLVADAGSFALSDLRGTLDGAAVGGAVAARFGARPAVSAALDLARLSVDGWIPAGWREPSAAVLERALARLREVDADVKLQVQDARWGAWAAGPAALELQTEAARIVLRRLEARPFGGRLLLSGQLAEGNRLVDGRLELSAPDLEAWRPLLPEALPAPFGALLRGGGSAVIQAAGPPEALAGRGTLELSDLRVEVQPVVNVIARRAAGSLTVHHPGAPRLLQTLGAGDTVAWLGDGSFSLVGQASVAPGRLELSGATLAAGAGRAQGSLLLEGRRLSGQVAAETLPLPLPYARSLDPLPLGWPTDAAVQLRVEAAQVLLGLVPVAQAAGADLVVQGGTLRLSRITARTAGGTVAGTAALDTTAEPPRLAVQGQATGLSIEGGALDLPVDVVAGQADLALDLAASGYSPAAMLATLLGTGSVRVHDGVLQGVDLAAAAAALAQPAMADALGAARSALLTGATPFTAGEAKLSLQRGVVGVDGSLAAETGRITIGGSVDLRAGAPDLRFALQPARSDAPVLGLRLTGAAGKPVRTPELAAFARWLADRPPAP